MSRKTKNLTFLPVVVQKADEIMLKTGDPSFSALCVRLINEEHDRRIDREAWLVISIAEALGKTPGEVRAMIDERIPEAEKQLRHERRKGRVKAK